MISVTRFGEMLPFGQKYIVFGHLFSIWQTFKPTLAYFYIIGQIFITAMAKNPTKSNHVVTMSNTHSYLTSPTPSKFF